MIIPLQKFLDIATSFVYSWIPALLILWFLVARKLNTKLPAVLLGFFLGAVLSSAAGYANRYAALNLFPGDENPTFFMAVGLIEETIKFVASFGGLFLISRTLWKEDLNKNWLAQVLSGSLGFAAAENFIYGIDGQGGIARVVPLIAHIFFAVFWGLGFYKFSLLKTLKGNSASSLWAFSWVLLGLIEGILLHGLYDCVVSENIIPDPLKVVAWIVVGILIIVIFSLHYNQAKKLEQQKKEIEESFTLNSDSNSLNESSNETKNEKPSLGWSFTSLFFPGAGHLMGKGEFFIGISFFLLSLLAPYLLIRLSINELVSKFNLGAINQEQMLNSFLIIAACALLCYLAVGFWSAWELRQSNTDINPEDRKKRLTAFFPVSTLFFVSLMMSFFLPAFEKAKQSNSGEDKKVVIKEIPLGISWEVEKVAPAPQKDKNKSSDLPDDYNSIALDNALKDEANKYSDPDEKNPSVDKTPSGVKNSDSLSRKNLPDKLPKIGYIGVQLSEIVFQGQSRSYIAFVYPGTSAARAGLKTGDFVLSVDGKSTKGLDAFEVSRLVRGPLGSKVKILVYREGVGEVEIVAHRTGTIFSEDEGNQLLNPTIDRLRRMKNL